MIFLLKLYPFLCLSKATFAANDCKITSVGCQAPNKAIMSVDACEATDDEISLTLNFIEPQSKLYVISSLMVDCE